eukprot:1153419-Pelagomonas_calceolata.AAC.12
MKEKETHWLRRALSLLLHKGYRPESANGDWVGYWKRMLECRKVLCPGGQAPKSCVLSLGVAIPAARP